MRKDRAYKNRIQKVCEQLNLPAYVGSYAYVVFKNAREKKVGMGRNLQCIMASCIYLAARQHNIPVQLDYFAEMLGVRKKTLWKYYAFLCDLYKLNIKSHSIENIITACMEKLRVGEEYISCAKKVYQMICECSFIHGKNPYVVAAAVIYIALKGEVSQIRVAVACGVSEVSLRNMYHEIIAHKPVVQFVPVPQKNGILRR